MAYRRGGETLLTHQLKWAAWEWLYNSAQCRCIGMEVKLEGPGGRVVDLAAVGPENAIYIVEVKASRADFLRDNHTLNDWIKLQKLQDCHRDRRGLAEQILQQAASYAQQCQPTS
ncbi:MAG: MmcB family DNA repair protein [SAR202 cluster bacterium]|nr:MmcB family DNA repair protein [SAR202 cluster bacterium]